MQFVQVLNRKKKKIRELKQQGMFPWLVPCTCDGGGVLVVVMMLKRW